MSLLSTLSRWTSFAPFATSTTQPSNTQLHAKAKPEKAKVIHGRVSKAKPPKQTGTNFLTSTKRDLQNLVESYLRIERDAEDDGSGSSEYMTTWDPNDETLIDDQEQSTTAAESKSLSDADILDSWSADERWLLQKLNHRGDEPLMPANYQWDFPSFPDILFEPREGRGFIHGMSTSVTEVVGEFATLVDNGARCRDLQSQDRDPEYSLARGIQRFKNWSIRDGGLNLKRHLDLIIICPAKPSERSRVVVDRATQRLVKLGKDWRGEARQIGLAPFDIPSLYAFVVKYNIVMILSFDPNMPNSPIRTIAKLDHQHIGHDVWHAYAIAIVCVHARNRLLEVDSNGAFESLRPSIED